MLLISFVMGSPALTSSNAHRAARVVPLLLVLASLSWLPSGASADSPMVIRGASTAVLTIQHSIGIAQISSVRLAVRKPVSELRHLAGGDLLREAASLLDEGVRIVGLRPGETLYLHVQPRGLGGVVSLRLRR